MHTHTIHADTTRHIKKMFLSRWSAALTAIVLFLTLTAATVYGAQDRTLHVYTWSDYFDSDVIYNFEQEYNCRVALDYFDSGDSLYAKLKIQGDGYDVIISPSYISAIMWHQGMIRALEHDRLPNLPNIDKSLAALTEDPDMSYAIPYTRVVSGIGYNSLRVSEDDLGSWGIFGNRKYAQRMTLANDIRETIGAALKYLGYSLNTTNTEEVEKAGDVLTVWKSNIAKFDIDEAKIGLGTGEFSVVHGYNGDIALVQLDNPDIGFFFPREGTSLAVDQMVMPTGVTLPELAHTFINYMMDPHVAARNMEGIRYYMPNLPAVELLPEELRTMSTFDIPDDILAKSEIIRDLGHGNAKYITVWNRVKAY